MIRWETYRSCEADPAPEKAFVALGAIVERRLKPKPHDFTTGHMIFFGETEVAAREKGEAWVARERQKLVDQEAARQARMATTRQKRASTPSQPTEVER